VTYKLENNIDVMKTAAHFQKRKSNEAKDPILFDLIGLFY
jgi:hypothetical protein